MPGDALAHVIDDDEAVRQSIEFLLRSAKIPVKTYESAMAFLDGVAGISSGCIVTDVRMPEMSGMDLLRRLKEMRVDLPVIIMTGHGDVPLAVEAMKAGAADFIEKPFDDEVILNAIRAALSGKKSNDRRSAERAEIDERLSSLSARERQVLEGLVAGHSNKVIARNLNISPRTVEIYRANVMTKMKAPSLSDLVRMALISELLGGS
jgi:two-component system response regulator FixJ